MINKSCIFGAGVLEFFLNASNLILKKKEDKILDFLFLLNLLFNGLKFDRFFV